MADITGNEGASLERQAWVAKLKRMKKSNPVFGVVDTLDHLIDFGEKRAARNAEAPGSLGRKKAGDRMDANSAITHGGKY